MGHRLESIAIPPTQKYLVHAGKLTHPDEHLIFLHHRRTIQAKMVVLNSNPEILLKKRKNNERKRVEKQEAARSRIAEHKKRNLLKSKKFVRAETLVSNHKSALLEAKRVKNLTKYEQNVKDSISTEKDIEPVLYFVVRIPDHQKGLKIPSKSRKVLQLLRLNKSNTGVFVQATAATIPLLKLIQPYVVLGKPLLNSVRKLFQKRACISEAVEEEGEASSSKISKLDNNEAVENEFEDEGLVCIEDLVHEIVTMGPAFKRISHWVLPFKLNVPVAGWGPQAKLAKLEYNEDHQQKVSLAGNVQLQEIDIDGVIDEQN